MKIKLYSWLDDDYCQHNVLLNSETKKEILDICDLAQDCPEDATLSRCMINGNQVIKFIEMGYELGIRHEELIIEYADCNPEDEDKM